MLVIHLSKSSTSNNFWRTLLEHVVLTNEYLRNRSYFPKF